MLRQLVRRIMYGPKGKIRPVEALVVEAAASASGLFGALIRSQLATWDMIQRGGPHESVVAFHFFPESKKRVKPIEDRREDLCLCEVAISASNSTRCARVVFHKGFLSSVEFSGPIDHSLSWNVTEVRVTMTAKSITNDQEHS